MNYNFYTSVTHIQIYFLYIPLFAVLNTADMKLISLCFNLDSYVKLCVTQKGRTEVHKQTQVKKNNSQPSYQDKFAFSIDVNELESTNITFKVMSKEMLKGDTVIGECQLGYASGNRSSFWSSLLNTPSNKISQWSDLL